MIALGMRDAAVKYRKMMLKNNGKIYIASYRQ